MTDKQIIIYKKECYNEPHCSLNQVLEQLKRSEAQCEAMFVSHTDLEKKYKAKEQECEELKKEIAFGNNGTLSDKIRAEVFKELNNENKQLKAENDELKSLLKVRIEDLCDSCGASSMMPMPCKVYEKTLTEIKEIAEKGFESSQLTKLILDLILQKISEVLNV